MKAEEIVVCEQCGERLSSSRAKWLELSSTDGNYYKTIPQGHISQGFFSFGATCATQQINKN